jgi:hypothetical protein
MPSAADAAATATLFNGCWRSPSFQRGRVQRFAQSHVTAVVSALIIYINLLGWGLASLSSPRRSRWGVLPRLLLATMMVTVLALACLPLVSTATAAPTLTRLGSFSCNGGFTEGPGFLAVDCDALLVSRFSGDPLETDDLASVSNFVPLLLNGSVSTAACVRVAPLTWPNDAEPVDFGFARGVLAPGGFLVPPKTIGAVTFVNSTAGSAPANVFVLSAPKILPGDGWFFHRAVPFDVDGDGRLDVLAARAVKPLLTAPAGELVWLRQPAAAPLAPASLPWAEAVLASGAWSPDVLFAPPTSLRGDADSQLLFASFFTGGGLGLLQCAGCAGATPVSTWAAATLETAVIDASVGPAFDVAVLDLNGDGRLDVLLSNHADNATAVNGTIYQSMVLAYEAPHAPLRVTNASAWTRHVLTAGFVVREAGPNQAAPGAARAFPAPGGGTGAKPWISVSGDGDQRAYVLVPDSQDPLNWSYTRSLVHDCAGTVGRQVSVEAGGRSFLAVPCYDSAMIEVYEVAA